MNTGGEACSAWFFPPEPGDAPAPVVVMAHGFAGTKDSGLAGFAERLQAAGLAVLAFDYRGFGTSEGRLRQQISIARQLDDYRAAVDTAVRQPGVDPDRVVLWGVSLSGGHVIRLADETRAAAVIALTPLTDVLSTGRHVLSGYGAVTVLRNTADGVRSRIGAAAGAEPVLMPVVTPDGHRALLGPGGAYDGYLSIAGPSWRNEIDAAVGLELGRISTARYAKRMTAPLLVQIADFDSYVSAEAAMKTARHGRGIVHHYPCDHFDVWPGRGWFEHAVSDQLRFLRRVLGTAPERHQGGP
ncbi:alpha/beta hydrolase [Mycolicibacterium insubricum]|uniref:Alpha/beta hydrolase n=1 Tax=Mycolicibacterium insubricum TaxID=444597 RepID=A0A1X0DFS2_9MYCO|nr:alpha/beta hydrolase [Mycolicibacterium insubricum]ORA71241.1 alpha/beta hydrolase [Mycolicibacterium insubricum]